MSLFLCPVCTGVLTREGGSLRCPMGHLFDVSASGYVNLLSGGRGVTGDSKEMCLSRNRFLSQNYYACLAQALCGLLCERLPAKPGPVLVDAACGEGYYTAAMFAALTQRHPGALVAGVDLSKHALKYAAKRCQGAEFAVSSIFEMPLPGACADVITNLFAPIAWAEFHRVLRPGGLLVVVGPSERHLWGLKAFLYEHPYLNEQALHSQPGFHAVERRVVTDAIRLPRAQDIQDLFSMTPYFWKTPKEAVQRLQALETLETEIGFDIQVLQKQ